MMRPVSLIALMLVSPVFAAPADAPLPAGAVTRLGAARMMHGSNVSAVALSADGALLATGGGDVNYRGESVDSSIRLWDVATGKQLHQLAGHGGGVSHLVLSADGKMLASAGRDSTIKLWDTGSGKLLHQLKSLQLAGAALAFSSDGQMIASGHVDKTLRLWDASAGKEVRTLATLPVVSSSVAFAPDGQTLASGSSDGTLRLWEVTSGKEALRINAHRHDVAAVAFSPDGQLLASGGRDGTVRLWEPSSGKEIRCFGGDESNDVAVVDRCSLVTFSADGKLLVSAWNEGTFFRQWDVATGKELPRFQARGVGYARFSLAIAAKPLTIAAGHRNGGFISLWDLRSGQELRYAGHEREVLAVAFSRDGQTVATGSNDRTIRLWEASTGRELRKLAGHVDPVRHLAFSPDGKTLASAAQGDLAISLWDVASGQEIRQFRGFLTISALAFSPDGQTLYAGGGDGDFTEQTIWLWDVATSKERKQVKIPRAFNLAFTPDCKLVAQLGNDPQTGTSVLSLFDVENGKELRALDLPPNSRIGALAFSPDGRILAAGGQNQLIDPQGQVTARRLVGLWDVASGRPIQISLENQPPQAFNYYYGTSSFQLAFSRDGRTLAWAPGERSNRTIHLWEVATGKVRRQFTGHQREISALAFAPDGKSLISGSGDTMALIWDVLAPDQKRTGDLTAKELTDLETDLAGADGIKAFRAVRLLATVPHQVVPFLQERLKPVPGVDPQRVDQLIKELDSSSFMVRTKASEELEKLAELAQPALQQAVEGKPSLEVRQRIEQLLGQLHGRAIPPQQVRVVRAIEVLEQIGTPEARLVLEAMSKGAPGARVTQDAQTALKRISK
jgi:WD40 repeat protein